MSDGAEWTGGGRGDRLPLFFALLGSEQPLADNGSVKQTLEVINNMQADGVIGQYAIGGAVGATFCLEPSPR